MNIFKRKVPKSNKAARHQQNYCIECKWHEWTIVDNRCKFPASMVRDLVKGVEVYPTCTDQRYYSTTHQFETRPGSEYAGNTEKLRKHIPNGSMCGREGIYWEQKEK